ncbi:choice-of-anchor J domain-containing protein, partial [Flavobacterium ponti]
MMKKITLFLVMLLLSFTGYAQFPENFEGTTVPNYTTDDWVLSGGTWKVFDNGIGTTQSWGVLPAPNSCNGRSAYLNNENVTNGTFAEDWLVSPLTVPVIANAQLRFSAKQTLAANFGSIYTIRVSTTSQTDASTFTTIQTWTETELNDVYNVCEEKVVSLAAYAGQQIYVAFVMTNDNGDRWILDDINIVEQCLDPTNQTATNPTLTSSTLGWTSPGSATNWEVEIVPSAGTPTGTGTVVSTNPYVATGLTQGTCYDYYVRSLCAFGTPTAANSEWIGPFNFCTASLGETCGAPIVVPSFPYSTCDTTSAYGDDYSGSPGSSGCGSTSAYLNGDDVVYSFTATTANSITITSLTNSNWSGLFVYNNCTNVGGSCVAGNTGGNGTTVPDSVTFFPTIGQTYYVVISSWATNAATQSVDYCLNIIENSCTNMTSAFNLLSNCTSTTDPDTFYVTANVTNMGTATSITGTSTPASPTPVPSLTAPGTMQFGPFPNGTDVTVHLQNDQDANCFKDSAVFNQQFCPATNNLCADAIPIVCGSAPITQTTQGATTTGAPTGTCGTTGGSGGLWYSFTGTGDIVTFSLCGSAFDTKIQVVTGTCGAFTCVTGNDDFAGCGNQSQVQFITTVGTNYYIYVYGFGTAQGVFTLTTTCTPPPPPPANDNCDNATPVTVNTNTNCTQVTPGTVVGASPSSQANGCVGSADDDVWFSFVATHTTHNINLLNINGSTLDLNHVVYSTTDPSNPCGNLTQILCSNPDSSTVTGLTVGQVYYIRVYTAVATALQTTTFNVCVTPPPNYCNGDHFYDSGGPNGDYMNSENTTTTICPSTPGDVVVVIFNSFNLENNFDFLRIYDGSTTTAPLLGTFTNTNLPPQFISTATNGCLTFNFTSDTSVVRPGWDATILCVPPPACPQPNNLSIVSTNSTGATLAWNETGTATNWNVVVQPAGTGYPTSSSTIIPASTNPFTVTGLNSSFQYEFFVQADCGSPDGTSFWSGPFPFNTTFAGCGTNPAAGNDCPTAQPICNLNGYCGNTSATYGDNSWTQLDTAFCGSIENNSFLTFVATSTTISLNVSVQNCTNNNGIQMMIFTAATCGSGPVTSLTCWSPGNVPTGPATVSASGLVVGNTYYLMIDGFAGDVCDYSISASGGGTQTDVDITPATATVCLGGSIDLVASGGNGSFAWTPATDLNTTSGATVTYTPSAIGTYTITVDSTDPNPTCSSSDTTTITVVNTLTASITSNSPVCINDDAIFTITGTPNAIITYSIDGGASQSVTLDASGDGVVTVPGVTSDTTISLSNIAISTCTSTISDTHTVSVLSSLTGPTLTSNSPICSGSDAIFTLTGGSPNAIVSYTIDGGASQDITLDANGDASINIANATSDVVILLSNINVGACNTSLTDTLTVTILAASTAPTLSTNSPVCQNSDAIFTITGIPNSIVTYTIDNGLSQNVTLDASGNGTITVPNITAATTIDLVNVFDGSCNLSLSNSDTVTITPSPVLDPVSAVVACDSYSLPALTVGDYYSQPGGVDPINIANPITS